MRRVCGKYSRLHDMSKIGIIEEMSKSVNKTIYIAQLIRYCNGMFILSLTLCFQKKPFRTLGVIPDSLHFLQDLTLPTRHCFTF